MSQSRLLLRNIPDAVTKVSEPGPAMVFRVESISPNARPFTSDLGLLTSPLKFLSDIAARAVAWIRLDISRLRSIKVALSIFLYALNTLLIETLFQLAREPLEAWIAHLDTL